ncbi:MAG: winged helix-turn-helix transcriptional regulator [Paludibacteraceae bacterium]|nr:winged helix-turn-helix transcriptional regulator [Paludibacteraceae bacterium]
MYYKAGNIELNSTTHIVLRDGEAVSLTPLEFAMLEYLMRHPNRVCKRADVIDIVWGQRFRYDTGTIDVHLNALRRKLGFARTHPIETVRGAGLILHTDDSPPPHVLTIRPFITDWLHSHSGDFESKGLVPQMQLDPFVSEITMSPDALRTMLDGILAALLPSASPGSIRVSSQLRLHTFSLTLAINDTVNELRIPIYGDTPAS